MPLSDIGNIWRTVTDAVTPVETERLPIEECFGRVLAMDIVSPEDVPSYTRSAFDGYAFRSVDTAAVSENSPAVLRILEEVPAGKLPTEALSPMTAVKILTGATIPEGADAVVKHEETVFNDSEVRIFRKFASGDGILPVGSDLRIGESVLKAGCVIGAAEAGVLASLGYASLTVYRRPKIGIIATGTEVVEIDAPIKKGRLRAGNSYMLASAVTALGCEAELLGIASDCVEDIAGLIFIGLADCDMIISTGGVSAGDYDLTPDAIAAAGGEVLFRRPSYAPGCACAYGVGHGKLICALSGAPGAAYINYLAFASAAVKKLCGRSDCIPQITRLILRGSVCAGKNARLIGGTAVLSDTPCFLSPDRRISPLVRMPQITALALVPSGSDLHDGDEIDCILL